MKFQIKLVMTILLGAACGLLLSGIADAGHIDTSQCTYKTFRVTSYYSPLRGQDFYYKPNFEEEVILNGRGTHGASGRAVFNGMIAAPKSYEFGTKIYFPGRGVGQVEDRGGWIVEKGKRGEVYDRIDIWGGKGEDGLRRALSFGVQYLKGYICPAGVIPHEVGFDYDRFPSYDDFFERMLRIMSLEPGRDDFFVKSLQRYLVALGYLDQTSTTGKYGRLTKAAVCAYQQRFMGLSADHEACGTFGPVTRSSMRKVVTKKGIKLRPFGLTKATPISASAEQLASLSPQQKLNHHLFSNNGELSEFEVNEPIIKGTESWEVRALQRKLARLGHYTQPEITGVYDNHTISAVFDFQKSQGVITGNENPKVFGYLGPATRGVLNRL